MTSELRPSGSSSEFTCGGPKHYAYRVVDTVTGAGRTVCNVRGITLNYSASKLVNVYVIRDMILKGDEPSVVNVDTEHKIKRKPKGAEPSQLSPNLKTKSTGFRFSRGGG